jgi:hypothetical protein
MWKRLIYLTVLIGALVLPLTSYEAIAGAFKDTKHGGGTVDSIGHAGVDRRITDPPSFGAYYFEDADAGEYQTGECNHCHEPHSSFGEQEPPPTGSTANDYLLFQAPGSSFCWACHDELTVGSVKGYGYLDFYQGSTIYGASSHGSSANVEWPGDASLTGPTKWPRYYDRDTANANTNECINCHTPHGLKGDGTNPTNFDIGAVPTARQTNPPNVGVSTDYLIPRQLTAWEEVLCENCHDGSPCIDIASDIDERSAFGSGHPVDDTSLSGLHIASEALPVTTKHVECYDCHNPHAAKAPTGVLGDGDGGRMKGMKYIDINAAAKDPAGGDRQPYVYEVCLKCHGNTFATFIEADEFATAYSEPTQPLRTSTGNPASSFTYGSNKRLEFDTTSTGSQPACFGDANNCNPSPSSNTAYHPVAAVGINQTDAINRQLLGGLDNDKTINCTDCHNTDATSATSGPVTESNLRTTDVVTAYAGASALGTHGSTPTAVGGYQTHRMLRANYDTTLGVWDGSDWDEPFSDYNENRFALCFLCHDEDAFSCQPAGGDPVVICGWSSGPETNFYSLINDTNLHAAHVAGKGYLTDGTFSTCANCHYNVHSNVEAVNTMYEDHVDTTNWDRTADGSRLVNYSPIVGPSSLWIYTEPFWGCVFFFSQRKGCSFDCHGFDTELVYTPPDVATSCP